MIRKAEVKDASRLAEILIFAKRTAYRPIFKNDYVSFQEMQVLDLALHYQSTPGMLEDVYVFDDGIVRGMMHWNRSAAAEGEPAWELQELYIDPFFQGQGIGREMIAAFLDAAQSHQASKACLWVLEKNARAVGFYEARGFQKSGEKKLQPGTSEYLLRYIKRIG